jgi:hypothetical protein
MKTPEQIDDGGPAFPATCSSEGIPLVVSYPSETVSGMTLRDYFAAAAMQGYCLNSDFVSMSDKTLAKGAYELADSMLAARKEGA